MIAYEFYCRDDGNGDRLVGILPERRRNPGRITEDSIMKWIRKVLDDQYDIRRVFFARVTVEDHHNDNFWWGSVT